MPQTLRYGANCTFQIDFPEHMHLVDFSNGGLECLDDPAAAMAAALSDPLQFPPLARATVAGDRIAITLEPGLPQANALVAGVVHELMANGSRASDITIVVACPDSDSTQLLPDEIRREIRVVIHHGKQPSDLAYLANSKAGHPIYLNRAICDADVVIPIGTFRLGTTPGQSCIHSCLYPIFSGQPDDTETKDESVDSRGVEVQPADPEEVAWLLGVQFAVQIVPGRGAGVLHILAGDAHAVASRGRDLCESTWRFKISHRAGLVVATIDGGPEQQTWENFSRALINAAKAVADGGAIVICSELSQQPGSSPTNSIDVEKLADLQRDANVYLLSDLAEEVVEDMGLAHVSSTDQISRLSNNYESCVLVPGAQHAVVVATED